MKKEFKIARQKSTSGKSMLKIGPYPYTLRYELGKTNMSCTWRALEQRREVVLKIARWDQADQFKRNQRAIDNEEQWLRKLQAPETTPNGLVNLLPIAGSGQRKIYNAKTEEEGNPRFISLVYLPGGSLHHFVQSAGRVPVKQALNILHQLAETLHYVHGHGCIHLDLKSDNIMFRQVATAQSKLTDVQPVLIDFGIAGEADTHQYVGGVARWLSPECLLAKEKVEKIFLHPGMDIYPLGLILHYMLTGVLPKPKAVPAPIMPAMLQHDPTVPKRYQKQLAGELTQFIQMMSAPDMRKRPSAQVVSRYAQRLIEERTDAQSLSESSGQVNSKKDVGKKHLPARRRWRIQPAKTARKFRTAGIIASLVGILFLTGILLQQAVVPPAGISNSAQAQQTVQELATESTQVQTDSTTGSANGEAAIAETASISTAVAAASIAPIDNRLGQTIDNATTIITATPLITGTVIDTVTGTDTGTGTVTDTVRAPINPTPTVDASRQITTPVPTSPVPTSTDTPTRNAPPTSTLIPTSTDTPSPTPMPSLMPSSKPSATPMPAMQSGSTTVGAAAASMVLSATPYVTPYVAPYIVPTATPYVTPYVPPSATPYVTAATVMGSPSIPTQPLITNVMVIQPIDGASSPRQVTFEWQAYERLASNEHFEVAFWKPDQDPYVNAFGLTGSGNYTSVEINLRKLRESRPDLLMPDQQYLWGVWIVRANDGKRLRLVSEQRTFRFTTK